MAPLLCVCPSPTGRRVLNPSSEPCSRNLFLSKKPPQEVESENHSVVSLSSKRRRGDQAHRGSFMCCRQPVAALGFLGGVLAHVAGV